ncbi:MAG: (4Fe-4S)-binding protein [Deltaproteobacteria bacterium]|nr:MAG: (4Fe-4S)-binding protein [Deltaproteobacteria bacterium]
MKELVIISGKGGTGKTSVSASFAHLFTDKKILVDADVDAANLHLVIEPEKSDKFSFKSGISVSIDKDKCIKCGLCIERCEFNAINDNFEVNGINCEGCGVCYEFCPADAISIKDEEAGKWFISETVKGTMIHAKLNIGGENSGLLINQLRTQASKEAEKQNASLILIDGPPGTGCPATSSMTGADHVLIVCEPTQSGFHDMKRAKDLADFMKIPVMVAVNKFDLNPDITNQIEEYTIKSNADFMGKIPHDHDFPKAIMNKKTPVEYSSGEGAQQLKKIFDKVMKKIDLFY